MRRGRGAVVLGGSVLALAVVLAAACSSGTSGVSSERIDAVPIPSGATVNFRGATNSGSTRVDPSVPDDSVHHMIQSAIVAQLRQKGYTMVDSGTPATFAVRYFLRVDVKAAYAATGGGVSGPPVTGYGLGYGRTSETPLSTLPPPEQIKNASFEVDLVDEKAGRTAWRGMYTGEPRSSAPSEERINSLVGKIFETLPKVP